MTNGSDRKELRPDLVAIVQPNPGYLRGRFGNMDEVKEVRMRIRVVRLLRVQMQEVREAQGFHPA